MKSPRPVALIILTAAAWFASWILLDAMVIALGKKLYASTLIFYSPAIVIWLIALTAAILALNRAVVLTKAESRAARPDVSSVALAKEEAPVRHSLDDGGSAKADIIYSTLAIGVSLTGLTHIHIVYAQVVNGHLRHGIASWWFFTITLLLGLLALARQLFRRPVAPKS
ncbi:MAG TPA: hypothetical protein VMV72_07490 [Verrucomicrobiae bacterium]|nr:hypothetical protein [Verrucomicrobiae bacterium]